MRLDQKLKRALQQGHVTLTLHEEGEEEGSHYDCDDRDYLYYEWEEMLYSRVEEEEQVSCYDVDCDCDDYEDDYENYYDYADYDPY